MSSRTSQACSSLKNSTPVGGRLSTSLGTLLEAFLAFDAEADQGADLAAELLDRLVQGDVEVGDLDLAVGVFVDGQGVDHLDGVVAQPLQLLDLAVKLGWLKPRTMSCTGPMAILFPPSFERLAPLTLGSRWGPRASASRSG